MSQDNLHETEQVLEGEFQGLLSKLRTFQFDAGGEVGVITGKIAKALDNLERINREMNYRRVQIKVLSTQVGNGRPRYVLERVKSLRDPVVLNDEAHHVHDEDLAWSQSLLAIHRAPALIRRRLAGANSGP